MSEWGLARGIAVIVSCCVIAAAPPLTGCSSRGSPRSVGSIGSSGNSIGTVGVKLTVPNADNIDSVSYTLTDATGATIQSGAATAQGGSINFQLGNVPAGDGYSLALFASSDAGTTCVGTSGPFSVMAQATTNVVVNLGCYPAGVDAGNPGNVALTGALFNCAVWTSLVTMDPNHPNATCCETAVGSSIMLSATAAGIDPNALTYSWTSSSNVGVFGTNQATGTSDTIAFTCTAPGTTTITLVVGDGPVPDGSSCDPNRDTVTTSITCDGATAGPSGQAVAYQIDTGHTGAQPASTLTPPLTQRWSVNLGEGNVSYPLIAGGLVVVTVAHASTAGNGDDLYALDQGTGALVWGPIDLGGTYRWANAAYDNGNIFAVNGSGMLRAFDAPSGTQLWAVQLPGQYSFSSAPTATGGVVFVGGAGSGGTLYAVDETSGTVIWQQAVQNGDDSSPAVSASGVYVSYACNQTYDFAPGAGTPLWHFNGPCEGGGGRTPALVGSQLYARDPVQGNIIFDATTGTTLGSFSAGPIPAFDGSQGFFLAGGSLRAETLSSSNVEWTFTGDGNLVTAPIVANGNVYIGSSSGTLYAVDEASGTATWSTGVGAAIAGPDEQNVSQPLTGLGAAAGVLIVPASNLVVAYW